MEARHENELAVPGFLERALVAAEANARVMGSERQPHEPVDAGAPRLRRRIRDERWRVLHAGKNRKTGLFRQRMSLQARDLGQR